MGQNAHFLRCKMAGERCPDAEEHRIAACQHDDRLAAMRLDHRESFVEWRRPAHALGLDIAAQEIQMPPAAENDLG